MMAPATDNAGSIGSPPCLALGRGGHVVAACGSPRSARVLLRLPVQTPAAACAPAPALH